MSKEVSQLSPEMEAHWGYIKCSGSELSQLSPGSTLGIHKVASHGAHRNVRPSQLVYATITLRFAKKKRRNRVKSNPNLSVFTIFHIDLEPNGSQFGSTSIGKWYIQSDFGSIEQFPKRFLCVCFEEDIKLSLLCCRQRRNIDCVTQNCIFIFCQAMIAVIIFRTIL